MNFNNISTNLINKTTEINSNVRFNAFITSPLKADTFERQTQINFKGNDERQQLINSWGDLTTVSKKNEATVSRFSKEDLNYFAKFNEDEFKALKEYIPLKKSQFKPRFETLDLKVLAELGTENIANVKELAKTSLDAFAIKEILEKNPSLGYTEIAKNAVEMEKSTPEFKRLSTIQDKFVEGNVKLKAYSNNDNIEYSRTFNSKGQLISLESKEIQKIGEKTYEIVKAKDLRTNILSKTRFEITENNRRIVENEVKIVKDKNGNLIKKEYTDKSNVEGIYNSKIVYPDGKVKITSEASVDEKTKILSIKKDITSPTGVRTEYLYSDDPQGNRIIDYKITDKNGKILMNKSKTFEIINENKMISSIDGKSHEITIENNNLTVKNMQTNEKASFELGSYLNGDDKEGLLKILKQTSGEELIGLRKSVKSLSSIKDHLKSSMVTDSSKRLISEANAFSLLHELGHAKDIKNVDNVINTRLLKLQGADAICTDTKLEEIYKKEREEFNNTHTTSQQESISYFLLDDSLNRGEGDRGLRETIAESNALINTYCSIKEFGMRAHSLQQNFPQTIAYLANKLDT